VADNAAGKKDKSMKPIKLILNDEACALAIETVLEAVNGKAYSFAVTSAQSVFREAKVISKRLDALPQKDRGGAMAWYTPAGPAAKSFRYVSASTTLTFRIGANGKTVYLADVEKTSLYPQAKVYRSIALKAGSHARYVAARARDFGVLATNPADEVRRLAREARDEADRAVAANIED
jgi:hypothetical protein